METYTPDILRTTSIFAISKIIKMEATDIKEAFENGNRTLTKEQIINILSSDVPIEPFLIGIDTWEKILSDKNIRTETNEGFLSLLLDDAKKQKTHPYPLNKDAYLAFLKYRSEIFKKPVTKAGASRQKNLLRGYPIEIQQEIIAETIDKKWESLHKPKAYKIALFQKEIDRRKKKEEKGSGSENLFGDIYSESIKDDESMSVSEMIDFFKQ